MNGASLLANGTCNFRVWAPRAGQMKLRLVGGAEHAMTREADGFFSLTAPAHAGDRYFYLPDGHQPVPDPVSRLLPEGVHGPTEIVDPADFSWSDDSWRGLPLSDYIIYELHVGTFTPQGTFDGVIERLQYLKYELGITVIELMPVAAFPGGRNWGYDGVSPYAVQASYGGPQGLKRLVSAAHQIGLAVVLDVVYNHVGHEGNYLRMFGPYFTSRHQTPWGEAINYDSEGSEHVRRYFVENALYWIREYHLDGLRLDAIETIHDNSERHILAEMQDEVQSLARQLGRTVCVIAETNENEARLIRPPAKGGYGLDAQWSDDFHHSVHASLTGERQRYYQDFGDLRQIVRALNDGFVFQGEFFNYWKKARGTSSAGLPMESHVICLQNHDQVGNRARGERLSQIVPIGLRKVAAALMLLAPHTPLLFMGEEYDEPAPFLYFTSYGDPTLARAVSEGRKKEFQDFAGIDVPDPQDEATFQLSRLHWEMANDANDMLRWYRALIDLRKRYVLTGERSCRAELRGEHSILMQVPATEPGIQVLAEFVPSQRQWTPGKNWRLALWNDEKECAVTVYTAE
ncbi:MAG TPA: malto-oligosyltrehalose trehalohydrolase [Terriglobales bacterium]|nr:malto-oligosyltrehalose trehalohydrolase [Terriglobales bacterium]